MIASSLIICWPASWLTPFWLHLDYRGMTIASSHQAPLLLLLPVFWPLCPPPRSHILTAATPPSTMRAPCTAVIAPLLTGIHFIFHCNTDIFQLELYMLKIMLQLVIRFECHFSFSACLTVTLTSGAMHSSQSLPLQRWASMPSTCMR